MQYYLEYGGGLGDVFAQLYYRGSYNVLRDMESTDTADVFLITHNPHVKELFDYHPNKNRINVHDLGYWQDGPRPEGGTIDSHMREINGMHEPNYVWAHLPLKDSIVRFYPSPEDSILIKTIREPYILFNPGAGMNERNFPDEIINNLLDKLTKTNFQIVVVGKNYERNGKKEPLVPDKYNVINFTDKLTVPGTAALVQNCAGLVATHSALNMLGWMERVTQLLLYPQVVLDSHMKEGNPDRWMAGASFPETVHNLFSNYTDEMFDKFMAIAESRQ
jgi:hypothetical protein